MLLDVVVKSKVVTHRTLPTSGIIQETKVPGRVGNHPQFGPAILSDIRVGKPRNVVVRSPEHALVDLDEEVSLAPIICRREHCPYRQVGELRIGPLGHC